MAKFTESDIGSVLFISTEGKRQGLGATKSKPHADYGELLKVNGQRITVRRRTYSTPEWYHEKFWDFAPEIHIKVEQL